VSTAATAIEPIPGRPALRSCEPSSSHVARTANGSLRRTTEASFSSISVAAARGPYVQPRPVVSPAVTSTTTTVVELHSSVPSDSEPSGSSTGISYAETSSRSTWMSAATASATAFSAASP
jgi:hypothetical protein